MGLLTDLLEGYATGVSHRTGLHYVPSFNDLNTGSNDDLEEEVLKKEGKLPAAPQAYGSAPSPPASPSMFTHSSVRPRRPGSNKTDDGPGLSPYPDFHQVRTHMSGRHQMYDKPHRADEPSVWQIIADHQDQQDQPTKAK